LIVSVNENGYRVLGSYLAKRLGAPAGDACDDRWDATDTALATLVVKSAPSFHNLFYYFR
jgi:hypothetical protein